MIAIWDNGWDEGQTLSFVDVGNTEGLRTMSHLVALLRMCDKLNSDRQGVVATAPDMVFSPRLQPVAFPRWISEAFADVLAVREDVAQTALDRVLGAIPDAALQAASIWHVDGIAERIAHRKRR